MYSWLCISMMSAPAAKARSLPVMTMQPTIGGTVELARRRRQLVHQLRVERVQRLRPVQRDQRDAVAALEDDRLELAHEPALFEVLDDRRVDRGEVLAAEPALGQPLVDLGRVLAELGERAAGGGGALGEPQVLDHQVDGEAELVVLVGGARRDRPWTGQFVSSAQQRPADVETTS
ncbi:MAG: hypothetical protein U0R24_13395 [Solirubrobacterales bacterium]